MKKFLFIFLLCAGYRSMAQYDTSHIRVVLDYIHTPTFKNSLEKLSDRQTEQDIKNFKAIRQRKASYREQQRAHVLFWTASARCFIPHAEYKVPDTGTRLPDDSLAYRKFNPALLQMNYTSPRQFTCTEKETVQAYYLNEQVLELHHFTGMGNEGIKFGYTEILRFRVNNGKAELLHIGGIYHN
jgi:hypothetical protein